MDEDKKKKNRSRGSWGNGFTNSIISTSKIVLSWSDIGETRPLKEI